MIIREIKVQNACRMNKNWHSRLPIIDWSNVTRTGKYVCYGAYFNNKCLAIGIWSSPIARALNRKGILELRRMAISKNCPKNTASRMISIMTKLIKKRFPEIKKLISYQDIEVHSGTIYKASNWVIGCKTKGQSWTLSRKRNKDQTTADKIRWEYQL